jgi:hypothetical protein
VEGVSLEMSGEIGPQIEQPLVVEYQLTYEEAIQFYRWQLAQSYKLRRGVALMGLVVIGGLGLLAFPGGPRLVGILVLGAALLELLLFSWIYFKVPEKTWRRLEADRGTNRYEFTDANVRVRTNKTDSVNLWSVYSETLEMKETYLLRVGKGRSYAVIPKRALRSPNDEAGFRALVERHTVAHFERKS